MWHHYRKANGIILPNARAIGFQCHPPVRNNKIKKLCGEYCHNLMKGLNFKIFLTNCVVIAILFLAPMRGLTSESGGIGMQDIVPGIQSGFIAAMRCITYTGANNLHSQLVLYRTNPSDFQCLRKWINDTEFQDEKTAEAAKDPGIFDQAVSVVNNQIFSHDSQNLLEYDTGSASVIDETKHNDKPNIVVRDYMSESHYYFVLGGMGLTRVKGYNKPLGNNKYSVDTYAEKEGLVVFNPDNLNKSGTFTLYVDGKLTEISEYHLAPQGGGDFALLATLISHSYTQVGTNVASEISLEAKYYAIPATYPSLEDLHKKIYKQATSDLAYKSWGIITNGKIYGVSQPGKLIPSSAPIFVHDTSHMQSASSRPVGIALLFVSLTGLAVIAFSIFRKRNNEQK